MSDDRLPDLARRYAAGEVTWRAIADELDDVSFGDLLLELARQGLALPTATAPKTAEQQAAWEAVLQRAADDAFGVPAEEWERDHAVLKAWLARRGGRAADDDPSLTAEQREQIRRAIAREGEEGGDDKR